MFRMAYQSTKMSHFEALQTLGSSVALLKSQATRTLEFCCREASQIFGGKSFTIGGQGGRVEVIGREARVFSIFAGSEEIMIVSICFFLDLLMCRIKVLRWLLKTIKKFWPNNKNQSFKPINKRRVLFGNWQTLLIGFFMVVSNAPH